MILRILTRTPLWVWALPLALPLGALSELFLSRALGLLQLTRPTIQAQAHPHARTEPQAQ